MGRSSPSFIPLANLENSKGFIFSSTFGLCKSV